jgi:hypothetical protein
MLAAVCVIGVAGLGGWSIGHFRETATPAAAPSSHGKITVNIDKLRGRDLATDARNVLDEKLSDYPTARFKDVFLVHYDLGTNGRATEFGHRTTQIDSYVFCGLVNSKNAFGAYSGWMPFAVDSSELYIADRWQTENNNNAFVGSLCAGHGTAAWDILRNIASANTIIQADTKFMPLPAYLMAQPQSRQEQVELDRSHAERERRQADIARLHQSIQRDLTKLRQNDFEMLPHTIDRSEEWTKSLGWRAEQTRLSQSP